MRNTTGNFENTAPRMAGTRSVVFRTVAVFVFLTCFVSLASAQIPEGVNTAPPPIKRIPKDESENLKKQTKPNNRTKLALTLMDARLAKAEAANGANELDQLFTELGVFHAVMVDTLNYLVDLHRRTGKGFDNFKRFEIGLRRFTPRLEMLRREMPLTHEFYVRSLLRQLRDARTKATEPLFGSSVVRDS
ncbi:MAG: hypothetical protein QUS14_11810 [Pyrinomonadaceae bacterium]|nr:hypothetical protein [Pyrinomonadaceae bacterium]